MKQAIKFNFKDKRIFSFVFYVVLIGVIVLDLVFFFPLTGMLGQIKDQQKKNMQDLTLAKDLLAKKGQRVNIPLIAQDRVEQVLDSISQMADQSDLNSSFQNMDGQEKEDLPDLPYKEKSYVLNVIGSLKNLGSFLTKVKNMPDTIIDIDQVAVSRNGKSGSDVNAQITIVFFMDK